jgi:hypothetical protein
MNFEVDEFLKVTCFAPRVVYRKGDPDSSSESGVKQESGCNIVLSSASFDDFEGQKREAFRFLADHYSQVESFKQYQGEWAEIDFGIRPKVVEEGVMYTHSEFLPPELLLLTGTLGIWITLSYYWGKAENQPDTKAD